MTCCWTTVLSSESCALLDKHRVGTDLAMCSSFEKRPFPPSVYSFCCFSLLQQTLLVPSPRSHYFCHDYFLYSVPDSPFIHCSPEALFFFLGCNFIYPCVLLYLFPVCLPFCFPSLSDLTFVCTYSRFLWSHTSRRVEPYSPAQQVIRIFYSCSYFVVVGLKSNQALEQLHISWL